MHESRFAHELLKRLALAIAVVVAARAVENNVTRNAYNATRLAHGDLLHAAEYVALENLDRFALHFRFLAG